MHFEKYLPYAFHALQQGTHSRKLWEGRRGSLLKDLYPSSTSGLIGPAAWDEPRGWEKRAQSTSLPLGGPANSSKIELYANLWWLT